MRATNNCSAGDRPAPASLPVPDEVESGDSWRTCSPRNVKRFTGRGEDPEVRLRCEEPVDQGGGRLDHVLAVVEHEQGRAVAGEIGDHAREVVASAAGVDERAQYGTGDVASGAEPSEFHELNAARMRCAGLAGGFDREPGLAHAAGAGQRDQPCFGQLGGERSDVVGTANEIVDRLRKVRRHVLRRRERGKGVVGVDDKLVQALCALHVLEAVGAEVDPAGVGRQRSTRIAGNNLATVSGRGDPGDDVHGRTDVVVADHEGLAGVQSHPHADG